MKDLPPNPAQTRKKQSSRQKAECSTGLALKKGVGEEARSAWGGVLFLSKEVEALWALLSCQPLTSTLRECTERLTRVGPEISLVVLALKGTP